MRCISVIFIVFVGHFLAGCKKNKDVIALPEATRIGANTVGFIIDDYVWRPFLECGTFNDPCGKSHVVINTPFLSFSLGRNHQGKESNLAISTLDNASISSEGNKIDSVRVTYLGENFSGSDEGYYNRILSGSRFEVTRFDAVAQVISGEFHLILGGRNFRPDTVTLKSGRFDFKFQACLCD